MSPRKGILDRAQVLALAAGLLLTGTVTGCRATTSDNPFESGAAADQIQVTIENRNNNNASLWVLWEGGVRARLGDLPGNSTRTFSTPWRADVVRFEVDFVAAGDYTTRAIFVSPGDHLDLTLRQ